MFSFLFGLLGLVFPPMPQALWPVEEAELLFAGDAMQHQSQLDAARSRGSYDYRGCFDAVTPFVSRADYAIVNFEASIGGKPHTGYPCFSAPEEYASALVDAGFDYFLLANNHILDRRDKGLHRTISTLDTLRIPHSGIYHDTAARDSLCPELIYVNGFSIAMLNYTYGTNGITVQGPAVVNYIDTENIARDCARARAKGAELICVCIHWGDEYHLLPNKGQRELADKLVDMGVDMVIGGHPHVIQPMEMRPRPDGTQALVVYSLGNFLSGMRTDDTRGGAMVRVKLKRDNNRRAYVDSAYYSLVYVDPDFRLVPVSDATDVRAKKFKNNAEAIFDRHNIGVPPDPEFMK